MKIKIDTDWILTDKQFKLLVELDCLDENYFDFSKLEIDIDKYDEFGQLIDMGVIIQCRFSGKYRLSPIGNSLARHDIQ